jgi:hypothetical protein
MVIWRCPSSPLSASKMSAPYIKHTGNITKFKYPEILACFSLLPLRATLKNHHWQWPEYSPVLLTITKTTEHQLVVGNNQETTTLHIFHPCTRGGQGKHRSGGKMIDGLTRQFLALPLQPNHHSSARISL